MGEGFYLKNKWLFIIMTTNIGEFLPCSICNEYQDDIDCTQWCGGKDCESLICFRCSQSQETKYGYDYGWLHFNKCDKCANGNPTKNFPFKPLNKSDIKRLNTIE
jgi:hypothetical protein